MEIGMIMHGQEDDKMRWAVTYHIGDNNEIFTDIFEADNILDAYNKCFSKMFTSRILVV